MKSNKKQCYLKERKKRVPLPSSHQKVCSSHVAVVVGENRFENRVIGSEGKERDSQVRDKCITAIKIYLLSTAKNIHMLKFHLKMRTLHGLHYLLSIQNFSVYITNATVNIHLF